MTVEEAHQALALALRQHWSAASEGCHTSTDSMLGVITETSVYCIGCGAAVYESEPLVRSPPQQGKGKGYRTGVRRKAR